MLLVQGIAHVGDSDCTIFLERYTLNAAQNPDKNTSKAVGICHEQTAQISMEISSTSTFSQDINRGEISESPDIHSSNEKSW